MNYSSIFHYLSFGENNVNREFDFKAFRLVGLEAYYTDYIENKNINNFDHWLYSLCKYGSDKDEIKNIVNLNYFDTSLCISKYYNSKDNLYYDINDPKFRWPSIRQINKNSEEFSYNIILEKCEEKTLELILGKGRTIDLVVFDFLFFLSCPLGNLPFLNFNFSKFHTHYTFILILDIYLINFIINDFKEIIKNIF